MSVLAHPHGLTELPVVYFHTVRCRGFLLKDHNIIET